MPSVAEQLRASREARKLTIHQIADATKIKTEHIRALEGGDYSPFSAPVYIRGYVKAIAKTLKMDVPAAMADLESELALTQNFSGPPSLVPREKSILDWVMLQISRMQLQIIGPLIAIGVLIGLLFWASSVYQRGQTRDPLADLGQGLYQGQPTLDGQYLPLPPDATNLPPAR